MKSLVMTTSLILLSLAGYSQGSNPDSTFYPAEVISDSTLRPTSAGRRILSDVGDGVLNSKAISGDADVYGTQSFRTFDELRRKLRNPRNGVQYRVFEKYKSGFFEYDPSDNSSVDDGAMIIVSTNGKRFKRVYDRLNIQWFGAIPNDGLDDAPAIQKAVDFASYLAKGKAVFVPAGKYDTYNTIHLGYGITVNATPYTTIIFEGESGHIQTVRSTSIQTHFSDRPAFAISGARGTRIRNISIQGDNSYMISQNLVYPNQVANAEQISTWVNPAWASNAMSETAPFAAIAIDPYWGPAPAVKYPDVSFPSFIASGTTQYNKAASSDVAFQDIAINGFAVGIVESPSGNAGQDDFVRWDRLWLQYCIYGISVSHTDARLNSLKDSYINQCHTALTNSKHGAKKGKWGGSIINTGFDRCIQIIDFQEIGYPSGGPTKFINCYAEGLWRIGNWGNAIGASRDNSLEFDHCEFGFLQTGAAGVPSYILKSSDKANVKFNGGVIRGITSGLVIDAPPHLYSFEGGMMIEGAETRNQEYEKYADNALGNIYFTSLQNVNTQPASFNVKYMSYINGIRQFRFVSDVADTSPTAPACFYTKWLMGSTAGVASFAMGRKIQNPALCSYLVKSGLTSIALEGRDLTITLNGSYPELRYMQNGGNPGDVIVDRTSGSVFFIYNRTGHVIKAKLQNNYRFNAGVYSYITPINTGLVAEQFSIYNTRYYTPSMYTIGTLTSGNNVLTDVGTDSGIATSINTDFPVGSALYTNPNYDNIVSYAGTNNVITGVDATARTITLTGNAAKSESRRPIQIVILPGPANQ